MILLLLLLMLLLHSEENNKLLSKQRPSLHFKMKRFPCQVRLICWVLDPMFRFHIDPQHRTSRMYSWTPLYLRWITPRTTRFTRALKIGRVGKVLSIRRVHTCVTAARLLRRNSSDLHLTVRWTLTEAFRWFRNQYIMENAINQPRTLLSLSVAQRYNS